MGPRGRALGGAHRRDGQRPGGHPAAWQRPFVRGHGSTFRCSKEQSPDIVALVDLEEVNEVVSSGQTLPPNMHAAGQRRRWWGCRVSVSATAALAPLGRGGETVIQFVLIARAGQPKTPGVFVDGGACELGSGIEQTESALEDMRN